MEYDVEKKEIKSGKILNNLRPNKERVFMKPGKDNMEDRLNFVDFWANYIRTHSDKEWSRQQIVLIDSQIQGVRSIVRDKSEGYPVAPKKNNLKK